MQSFLFSSRLLSFTFLVSMTLVSQTLCHAHPTINTKSIRDLGSPGSLRSAQCPVVLPEHPPLPPSRVISGDASSPSLSQYVVAIWNAGQSRVCTGTVVGPFTIITSAGCAGEPTSINRASYVQHYLSNGTRATYTVSEVYLDSQYSSSSPTKPGSDFAILFLSDSLKDASSMRILDTTSMPSPDTAVRLAGYGSTDVLEDGSNFDISLYQIDLPAVSGTRCADMYSGIATIDATSQLCMGYETVPCGPCSGDEGAPAFVYAPDGTPVLVGVFSSRTNCEDPAYPAVATRIVYHIDTLSSPDLGLSFTQDIMEVSIDTNGSPVTSPGPSFSTIPLPSITTVPSPAASTPPSASNAMEPTPLTPSISSQPESISPQGLPDASQAPTNPSPSSGSGSGTGSGVDSGENIGTPEPTDDDGSDEDGGVSPGIIIGAAVAGVLLVFLIIAILCVVARRRSRSQEQEVAALSATPPPLAHEEEDDEEELYVKDDIGRAGQPRSSSVVGTYNYVPAVVPGGSDERVEMEQPRR